MNIKIAIPLFILILFVHFTAACASGQKNDVAVTATLTQTVAASGNYKPISLKICQTLQEMATQALSTTFTMEPSTPFADPLSGETGLGCTLTATGTGTNFADPGKVTADLVSAFIGWTEQPTYQASGPTGAATAMASDMGLMLIRAEWVPAPEVQCPSDQPISACDVKPEQKQYTIQIQAAQK
jgi:hypothetical protein